MKLALVSLLALLAPPGAARRATRLQEVSFAALALAPEEREECLALALNLAMSGDCEGGLARLDLARNGGSDDELAKRVALERTRLAAWIELRDAFLAELAAASKPLTLELDGKKIASPFKREGDELVLAKAPRPRIGVRELAPEALLPAIPKERFAGAKEWLKVYPYCVAANPKWKRLTTTDGASAELKRDAEEFYPRLARLGPAARALDQLAAHAPVTDAVSARAAVGEIEALLGQGRELECVRARLPRLSALAAKLLALVADSMELGQLVHAAVSTAGDGTPRLAYDFSSAEQARDWRVDDGYLAALRAPLEPVTTPRTSTEMTTGKAGFRDVGEFCWRHVLDFEAPVRVRYSVRWEPAKAPKVYAFALGCLADEGERHVRVNELGFLYVDEQDGRYTSVRPSGDATVKAGQTYALELASDGEKASVSVDGSPRAEAAAPGRKSGHVFLWGHSDLALAIPRLEIEGRVSADSMAKLRADWTRAELERLQLVPAR